ncbi:MAG: YhdT family protein [Bacillota bacterium]
MEETKNKKVIHEFLEDPRYRQCNKEALLGLGLGVLNLIWWFAWGYGLGSKPIENYSYVFGLPMWFFMSCIVGAVLFTSLAVLMVLKYFKDMPLGELSEEEAARMREMS